MILYFLNKRKIQDDCFGKRLYNDNTIYEKGGISLRQKDSPLKQEWLRLEKQENAFLQKRSSKTDSK